MRVVETLVILAVPASLTFQDAMPRQFRKPLGDESQPTLYIDTTVIVVVPTIEPDVAEDGRIDSD